MAIISGRLKKRNAGGRSIPVWKDSHSFGSPLSLPAVSGSPIISAILFENSQVPTLFKKRGPIGTNFALSFTGEIGNKGS